MDWLRCNKCYREMKKSNRTFSLTQCGHLYCSRCLVADVAAKCAVCGTENFQTMPLSKPPQLEMQNFFTPVDEYLAIGIKIEAFQDSQLAAVTRGFDEIEKKYENMKKAYWNGTKQMDLLAQTYQKLASETANLIAIRKTLLKAREVETESRDSSFLRYAQGHENQRNWGHFPTPSKSEKEQAPPNLPRQAADLPNTQQYPATDNFLLKAKLRTPEQAYDPMIPYSSRGNDSEGYESGSGLWSIPGSSSTPMGVFRVPSTQRVPKSVTSLRKKTSCRNN